MPKFEPGTFRAVGRQVLSPLSYVKPTPCYIQHTFTVDYERELAPLNYIFSYGTCRVCQGFMQWKSAQKVLLSMMLFSRRLFVLGQPAVEEEWTRDGVMRESKQFRDIILVGK
jgi:hypothetical protein